LQIYIAKEDTKFGLQAELDEILASNEFQLLKTLRGRFNGNGNFTDNNDQIKSEFTHLKSIFDKTKKLKIENCQLEIISMGMSRTPLSNRMVVPWFV
jgi:uncharacterized pyridoxal phosphate-containing UPF0001 family protein